MNSLYARFGKRVIDGCAAGAGLVMTAPVLAAVALAVRATHGSPVLFKQRRAGFQGKPFDILKFRTMTDARDADGNLLPDEQRLTKLGALLRKTSLDELPALYNVLIGEMSLVGPRPLLMEYLQYYTAEQHRRHEVLPGITGWAAVNGRNTTTWDQRFKLDHYYVENIGPSLDLKILLQTIGTVLSRKGVDPVETATMQPFRGSDTSREPG